MINLNTADELIAKIKKAIVNPNFKGHHLAFAEDVDPSSTAKLVAFKQTPDELIKVIETKANCVETEICKIRHNLVVFIRNEQNIPAVLGAIEFFTSN